MVSKITDVQDKIEFVMEEDTDWRQDSMDPPPYTGVMKDIAKGRYVGDEVYDKLDRQLLLSGIHTGEGLPDVDPPSWVDWEEVREGQALWREYAVPSFLSLAASLIIGYSIQRFSEVLTVSGYGKSADIAFERYQATGFHIQDWNRFPLDDPKSEGRQSLKKVRAMHAYARARATERGLTHREGDVLVSQYDMAETLLGFSAVSIDIIQYVVKKVPAEDQRKMVASWRLIAHFLGITDEYNVCRSLEFNKECFMDWHKWSRIRLMTIPKCGLELQRIVTEGFGENTPLSHQFFWGFTAMIYKQFVVRYKTTLPAKLGCPDPLPGVVPFLKYTLPLTQYKSVNDHVRRLMYKERDLFYSDPEQFRTQHKRKVRASKIVRSVVWPTFSFFYQLIFHGYLIAIVLGYFVIARLLL